MIGRDWRGALLALTVFGAAFLYRFNTLGGALGGFTNDEFGYLARARQIQVGEVPFRDFNDPGWFLTDYLAAAAQWIGGYNLRSEALLTVGMLALGAALIFLLARRAAGSALAGLTAVAIQVAIEPRHYNYPKIVLYAAGVTCAWAYVDKPGRGRLIAFGVLAGVASLFRHDHVVYLGALGLMTVALVHRAAPREGLRAAALLAAVVIGCVAPFLVFLEASGGVGEYFRTALIYVTRDAERTSFSLPRFSLDPLLPLAGITATLSQAEAPVNVRWAVVSDEERRAAESRYGLANGLPLDRTTWRYDLQDVSSSNIEALVRDRIVEDTHGLDRGTFTIDGQVRSFRSQFDNPRNATAYFYYLFVSLPVLASVVLVRLARAPGPARVMTSVPHLVPLVALAAMLNVGFLSRGSTNIRIGDVGVAAAILLAWILAALVGRDGRAVVRNGAGRLLARSAAVVLLVLAVLSTNGLTQSAQHLGQAYFTSGPGHAATRARAVWTELGRAPAVFTAGDEPHVRRVAAYVAACTEPTDRLFVLGMYPELYYFSNRLFAGGHAWLLPFYYSDDRDESAC